MPICPNCFNQTVDAICNVCGYDSTVAPLSFFLPTSTMLCDRYYIGTAREVSTLTITYVALDTISNKIVYIEEFFPVDIAFRADIAVSHSDRHNITYKTMLSDMYERWTKLSKIKSKCLPEIYDIISSSGTVYCVYEYHPKKTLEELVNQSHRLNWGDLKPSFMQLFSLISKLNSLGLSHCGISPSNIWVLPDNSLILKGFSLPEVRTASNMLKSELFSGYSAPEQYHKNMWQGEWTDVYSLGAVLYYVLSGTIPINSDKLLDGDKLPRLSTLNPDIPQNVIFAIETAMSPTIKTRFSTVDAFSAALLSETSSSTMVFSITEPTYEKPKNITNRIKPFFAKYAKPKSITVILLSLVATISIVINLSIATKLARVQGILNEQIESSLAAMVPDTPKLGTNFVGIHKNAINLSNYPHLKISFTYDYHEQLPKDIVISQSVLPTDYIPEDGKLILTISKGPRQLKMPYLIGSTKDFAGQLLTTMGAKYRFELDDGLGNTFPSGTVIGMSIAYGEHFDKENDTIVLTIKK